MVPHARPVNTRDTKEEAEGEDSIAVETVESFCERIDQQVEGFITGKLSIDEGIVEGSAKAKMITGQQESMGRDNYKDGLVYAERKAVLHEFGRKAYNKCTHCQAQTFTYRKEGTVKIIEYDLSRKHKDQNRALGRIRPDILTIHRKRSSRPRKKQRTIQADDDDSGVGSSEESEGEGDDLMDVDGMAGSADEQSDDDSDVAMHENNTGIARGVNGAIKGTRGRDERILPVEEVRAHIREVFKNEPVITGLLYGRHGANVWENGRPGSALKTVPASADIFFMDVLPVPPTRFRPASKMGDSFFENPQNTLLSNVLTTGQTIVTLNNRLREYTNAEKEDIEEEMVKIAVQERTRVFTQLLEAVFQIQHDVNSFMDSSKNPTPMRGGLLPPAGVKQTLEKKEGLFRKHMMGKRVNFAARSVISPDINIETNEIGVPPVFARKLTFPEPVTPHNVHVLRQLVIAGAHSYPGATMVQNEDGTQISLERKTIEERTAIANQLLTPQEGSASSSAAKGMSTLTPAINKKVLRHLRDGDILLLNRQPTLHKPSMMAHRARILHGEKTIRMHYANCNSYNADFDGDEMNIHFPQNEVAQAEARMIANTDNQYLGPTSGSPLRGLIQDHVVAAVHLCNKATYLTREQYHQLIYGALRTEDNYTGQGRIHTLPPAIWKPVPRWTGKQVVSGPSAASHRMLEKEVESGN
jgi:DNA-directed RNA polymerase I subunit RPA1